MGHIGHHHHHHTAAHAVHASPTFLLGYVRPAVPVECIDVVLQLDAPSGTPVPQMPKDMPALMDAGSYSLLMTQIVSAANSRTAGFAYSGLVRCLVGLLIPIGAALLVSTTSTVRYVVRLLGMDSKLHKVSISM